MIRARRKQTTHGVGKRVVIIKAPSTPVKAIDIELFGDVCNIETLRRACQDISTHMRQFGTLSKRHLQNEQRAQKSFDCVAHKKHAVIFDSLTLRYLKRNWQSLPRPLVNRGAELKSAGERSGVTQPPVLD